jgi:Na+-transporting methylmalonyl-CoA/oxaloacetate decarboxylase gamma subunit
MSEELRFALNLTLVGLVIVFAVLALIAGVVSLVRRLDERWQQKERAVEASRNTRPATIDATTLVILSAAVAALVGGRFQFRSIRRVGSALGEGSSWSQQGRAVLMGSHVIDRHSPEARPSGDSGRTH